VIKEDNHRLKVSCIHADPKRYLPPNSLLFEPLSTDLMIKLSVNLLSSFLDEQHQEYFSGELRQFISFDPVPVQDKRTHCCLYLLPPYSIGTKGSALLFLLFLL